MEKAVVRRITVADVIIIELSFHLIVYMIKFNIGAHILPLHDNKSQTSFL